MNKRDDRNELHVAELEPYKYYTIWLPDSTAAKLEYMIEMFPDKYSNIGDVIRSAFGDIEVQK